MVFIMRGLPGSGKTTLAKQLKNSFSESAEIVSADSFFVVDGQYEFKAELLSKAHQVCKERFIYFLKSGKSVIVDNTNSRRWEFEHYLQQAEVLKIPVAIVYPSTPWAWNPTKCAEKTTHNVPIQSIVSMLARWEN